MPTISYNSMDSKSIHSLLEIFGYGSDAAKRLKHKVIDSFLFSFVAAEDSAQDWADRHLQLFAERQGSEVESYNRSNVVATLNRYISVYKMRYLDTMNDRIKEALDKSYYKTRDLGSSLMDRGLSPEYTDLLLEVPSTKILDIVLQRVVDTNSGFELDDQRSISELLHLGSDIVIPDPSAFDHRRKSRIMVERTSKILDQLRKDKVLVGSMGVNPKRALVDLELSMVG